MILFGIRTTLEDERTVEPKETLKMLMMVPRHTPIELAFLSHVAALELALQHRQFLDK
jgi:hypothetical protein